VALKVHDIKVTLTIILPEVHLSDFDFGTVLAVIKSKYTTWPDYKPT
jgi:hypothetical protein